MHNRQAKRRFDWIKVRQKSPRRAAVVRPFNKTGLATKPIWAKLSDSDCGKIV